MGRKGGKYKKKENIGPVNKNSVRFDSDDEDMMHDEIDAFHKNRDVVPLNINEDMEESDEDIEQPVLDFEDDEDEDIDDDDEAPKGLAAKIVRTQKYLRAKFGGTEDEMLDDADEEEQERVVWGRKKDMYGADVDYEPHSTDDEDAAEEEAEVLKLQSEKAKVLSMEDFGLEDSSEDEADREPTFEEILDRGKSTSKASLDKGVKDEDGMTYEIVKKDLNALTKEEQMDVVYSSAPELVGLLSELNDALEQLENKVNPLVEKEILLCGVSFKNDISNRRVILYLNNCDCGRKHCQESAALVVKNQLKKVSLDKTAIEFLIENLPPSPCLTI